MENSLLDYQHDDSNFFNNIHQSLNEIENEHLNKEEVNYLLMQAISYLDKDLPINTAKELFSLIFSCFSHYSQELLPSISKFLEKTNKNSYHIIITASVLSCLARTHPQLSLNNYHSFINDSLNQILVQIQKDDEKGLKNTHYKILNSKRLEPTFSKTIIQKCNEIGMAIDTIESLIESISKSDQTSQISEYLKKYENLIHQEISDAKFNDIPNIDDLSEEALESRLLIINDLQLYLNVFPSIRFKHSFLSSPEFWIHISSLAAHSKVSISRKMANQFHFYFERFVDERKFETVLNGMIFSNETKTTFGMEFITQLIFNPKPLVKQNYLGNVKLNELLLKVLQTKIVLKSCFWKLFSKNLIFREFVAHKMPVLLYGYEFAIGKFEHEFETITIEQQTEESKSDLFEYILNYSTNYEVKEDFNEKALSFIAAAFLFTRKEGRISVEGLNDEMILPFLTVVFEQTNRLCNEKLKNEVLVVILDYFKSSQNFSLIKRACKSLKNNESPLLTISINRIIPHLYSLLVPQFFSFNFCLSILNTLLNCLFNGSYLADKTSLLLTFFKFSKGDHELNQESTSKSFNSDLLLLFSNFGVPLFEYIHKNLSEIMKNEELKRNPLNLDVFDSTVSSFIVNCIQNSTSVDESIQFICFIESCCINQPVFKFENAKLFDEILQKTIEENMQTESSLVYQFIIKNELDDDLHHLIESTFLISNLQQDTTNYALNFLFQKLMTEKSISTNYLTVLLQKSVNCNDKNNFDIDRLLTFYSKEYENSFVDAVDRLFVLEQKTSKLILKPEIEYLTSPQSSNFDHTFISHMLSEVNNKTDLFNAFIILKNIACSLPFLFIDKSKQVFDSVLPSLNNYLLVFDVNDEDKEKKAKAAVSALSFLVSTLCLPSFLDDFIVYLFDNIKTFTESQALCFVVVLYSLLCVDSIKLALMSQLIKFNFIEVSLSLLKRDLKEDSVKDFYTKIVCNLVELFSSSLNSLTPKDSIYVDLLMKKDKPFKTVLNDSITIIQNQQEKLLSEILNNDNEILKFAGEIESPKPFWISFESDKREKDEVSEDKISSFISRCSFKSDAVNDCKLHQQVVQPLNERMIIYLAEKPLWISKWIENPSDFVLISEHIEILNQTVSVLNSMKQESETELNQTDFSHFCTKEQKLELFDQIVMKSTTITTSNSFLSFCSLCAEVARNKDDLLLLLKRFSNCLKNDSTLDSVQKIIEAIVFVSKSSEFKENFSSLCGNDILEAVLTHDAKPQNDLIIKVSQLLSLCTGIQSLSKIVDFIGFMLLQNDARVVESAISLAGKLEETKQKSLNPLIQEVFDKAIEIDSKMEFCVPFILDKFPTVAKMRTKQLSCLLDHLLDRYGRESNQFNTNTSEIGDSNDKVPLGHFYTKVIDDEKLLDLIGSVIKAVAPRKPLNYTIKQSPSIESEISPSIVETAPDFWNVFAKHRRLITETVHQRPILLKTTFNFFLNFPELLELDIRLSYLKEASIEVSRDGILDLTIRSTNVLLDSFNSLNPLSTADFMRRLRINFHGEKNRVQNDTFYHLLIKELFDPRNYFFIYTENKKSFQINPRSDVIRKHLEYFRFAGKIIARSVLEGQTLPINIASCIYKFILQRPLEVSDLIDIDKELYTSLQRKLDEANNTGKNSNSTKDGKKDDDAVFFTLEFDDSEEEEEEAEEDITDQITTESHPMNSNQMYVDSKLENRLRKPIISQIEAFCEGFYSIIQFDHIRSILPSELSYLLSGVPKIDAEKIIKNIEIIQPLTTASPTVRAFFSALRQWDQERLIQFVLFATNSMRASFVGFDTLRREGNPIRIALGDSIDIPRSHPYAHLLLLPKCDDQNLMNWKFLVVFNEIESEKTLIKKVVKNRNKKKNVRNADD